MVAAGPKGPAGGSGGLEEYYLQPPHNFLDSATDLASDDIAFRIAGHTNTTLKVGQGPPYGTAQFVGPT